jgi:excisionase family DNA binding protein
MGNPTDHYTTDWRWGMSNEEAQVVAEGWITTSEAAELTGYTQDYCRQLAGAGRIEAQKLGRWWLVNKESLLQYQANVKPGRPKARRVAQ